MIKLDGHVRMDRSRMGYITPADLPRIKVVPLVPQDDAKFLQQRKVNKRAASAAAANALTYYCSLNNRRLWILKQCRELGIVDIVNPKHLTLTPTNLLLWKLWWFKIII